MINTKIYCPCIWGIVSLWGALSRASWPTVPTTDPFGSFKFTLGKVSLLGLLTTMDGVTGRNMNDFKAGNSALNMDDDFPMIA